MVSAHEQQLVSERAGIKLKLNAFANEHSTTNYLPLARTEHSGADVTLMPWKSKLTWEQVWCVGSQLSARELRIASFRRCSGEAWKHCHCGIRKLRIASIFI